MQGSILFCASSGAFLAYTELLINSWNTSCYGSMFLVNLTEEIWVGAYRNIHNKRPTRHFPIHFFLGFWVYIEMCNSDSFFALDMLGIRLVEIFSTKIWDLFALFREVGCLSSIPVPNLTCMPQSGGCLLMGLWEVFTMKFMIIKEFKS